MKKNERMSREEHNLRALWEGIKFLSILMFIGGIYELVKYIIT
jgi:hypothetical protein